MVLRLKVIEFVSEVDVSEWENGNGFGFWRILESDDQLSDV